MDSVKEMVGVVTQNEFYQQMKEQYKSAGVKLVEGTMSTKEFFEKTGQRIYIGGKRDNNKFSLQDVRQSVTIVKNDRQAAQMRAQHRKWADARGVPVIT